MRTITLVFTLLATTLAAQQSPARPDSAQSAPQAPVERVDARRDAALDAASTLIGRALFLRCFCAENNLNFTAEGKLQNDPKTVDWTLAAVNIQKATRKSPAAIELEGVRVAIRYATDRHEFDRHPLNDEKVKITLADSGNPTAFTHTLGDIFSTGIDRRLQHAMPEYWQHYFEPQLAWQDGLTNQTIYNPGAPNAPKDIMSAAPTHKAEATFTPPAAHDHVQGVSELRLVVDADGTPHRITINQPLGYGLDAAAAAAAAKYRFTPATLSGKPVNSAILLRQEFVLVPAP